MEIAYELNLKKEKTLSFRPKPSPYQPITNPATFDDLRQYIYEGKIRTKRIGDCVINATSGEIIGEYACQPYQPEYVVYDSPITYPSDQHDAAEDEHSFFIDDEGVFAPIYQVEDKFEHSAAVVEFPPKVSKGPKRGRPAVVIKNPLAPYFMHLMVMEERPLWMEDFVYAGITNGPGVNNGKLSVKASGVKRLLRLPEISTATASDVLVNHCCELMSSTQLERYVQAARMALDSMVHYLKQHPRILEDAGFPIDYEKYWMDREVDPKKVEAFLLLDQGVKKVEVCRQMSLSRPTLDRWIATR